MDHKGDWALVLPGLMSERAKAAIDEAHSLPVASRQCRMEHNCFAEQFAALSVRAEEALQLVQPMLPEVNLLRASLPDLHSEVDV